MKTTILFLLTSTLYCFLALCCFLVGPAPGQSPTPMSIFDRIRQIESEPSAKKSVSFSELTVGKKKTKYSEYTTITGYKGETCIIKPNRYPLFRGKTIVGWEKRGCTYYFLAGDIR